MALCFADVRIERKQVRRMYLKVNRDGTVSMTVPLCLNEKAVQAFFEEKKQWMEKVLRHMPAVPHFSYSQGEKHFFMGHPVFLTYYRGTRGSCRIDGTEVILTLPVRGADSQRLIRECWKKALYEQLQLSVSRWESVMGIRSAGFSIRAMKTRWGTCNLLTGRLCFALELSSKPVSCIEYVVLHELTHLLEAGHTPRFRAIMSWYMPDWKEKKQILNESPREFT